MNIYQGLLVLSLITPASAFATDESTDKQEPSSNAATMSEPTTAPPTTNSSSESKDLSTAPSKTADNHAMGGAGDISGTYVCKGYDPYNKRNYSFPIVEINKKGDLYNIQWQDDAGNPIMIGNAVTNPGAKDVYAIVYWPTKPDYYLVGQYVKADDGSLKSNWIVAGQKLVGTETCTKK